MKALTVQELIDNLQKIEDKSKPVICLEGDINKPKDKSEYFACFYLSSSSEKVILYHHTI